MSNLQTYHFQLYFQKVDQHTGKWSIHAPRKISCKTWKSTVEYPRWECKPDIKPSDENMFNPISKEKT